MFKNLFRPDSGLMIVMSQITDCIFLSLFFLLGCVPIVTAGASFAALYDATFRGLRDGERNSWQRFLHSYLQNIKSGILPTILFAPAAVGLCYGMIQCWNQAVYGNISWMLFAVFALLGILGAGVLSLLFPVLSRFENSFAGLLKNTVMLALANLPRTMILGVLNTLALALCLRLLIPLFFLPSLAALLSSWLIEPMFRPFMPQEEEETGEYLEEVAE